MVYLRVWHPHITLLLEGKWPFIIMGGFRDRLQSSTGRIAWLNVVTRPRACNRLSRSKIWLLILETTIYQIKDLKKDIRRPTKTCKASEDIFQNHFISKSLKGLCCKEIKNKNWKIQILVEMDLLMPSKDADFKTVSPKNLEVRSIIVENSFVNVKQLCLKLLAMIKLIFLLLPALS